MKEPLWTKQDTGVFLSGFNHILPAAAFVLMATAATISPNDSPELPPQEREARIAAEFVSSLYLGCVIAGTSVEGSGSRQQVGFDVRLIINQHIRHQLEEYGADGVTWDGPLLSADAVKYTTWEGPETPLHITSQARTEYDHDIPTEMHVQVEAPPLDDGKGIRVHLDSQAQYPDGEIRTSMLCGGAMVPSPHGWQPFSGSAE